MTAIAISSDARVLATGHDDGVVRVWNAQSGDLLRALPRADQRAAIRALSFSADGKILASADGRKLIEKAPVDERVTSGE